MVYLGFKKRWINYYAVDVCNNELSVMSLKLSFVNAGNSWDALNMEWALDSSYGMTQNL